VPSFEGLFCETTLMLLPIVKADGRAIGGGTVGKYVPRLREMYAARLRAEAGL